MLNLLYYLLLWLGYCWCFAFLCNRILSIPISHHVLDSLRFSFHDLPMLAGPYLIYWLSTHNHSSSGYTHTLTAIGGLGLAGIAHNFIQNQRQSYIAQKLSHRELIHRSQLKLKPGGLLTRLPGNESFSFEHNRKTLELFHLHPDLHDLSILHISDVHFRGKVPKEFFQHVFDHLSQHTFDLAIFSGDLVDNMNHLDWIEPTFGKIRSRFGNYFLLGNHDWSFGDPALLRDHLASAGWNDIASRHELLTIHGQKILLAGTEKPWMGTRPDAIPPLHQTDFRILVSHTPDTIHWARRHDFDLMLAGHNHGGQIRFPFYGPVYSPSRFGVRYACGLVDEPPTLIHISKGLSARLPIRYHCTPEATTLILHSNPHARLVRQSSFPIPANP